MQMNRLSKKIVITHKKGIHTRVAAFISYKASQISNKYNVKLFIGKSEKIKMIPLSSMLVLTSINIKPFEKICIACEGEYNVRIALEEMISLITGDIEWSENEVDGIDAIIDKNTFTSDQLVENIVNGVIVVNEKNEIILFNHIAEDIVKAKRRDVLGMNANSIIKNSKLSEVLKTGAPILNEKQVINNNTVITNRNPIIINGEICGAIAIFQNISELEKLTTKFESVNSVKNMFGNMLESFSEGICLLDLDGKISYTNNNFLDFLWIEENTIKNKNITVIFPEINIENLIDSNKHEIIFNIERENNKFVVSILNMFSNGEKIGFIMTMHKKLHINLLLKQLKKEEERANYFKEELLKKEPLNIAFDQIIGTSDTLHEVKYMANKASKTNATVLIYGESGTGKELMAKAIVAASNRKDESFIKLNCAAIPSTLIESELFGHVKGSFTGAINNKIGKFELANNGTIFLDEIGDLSISTQVKLLRVIQEREVVKIGSNKTIKINVRIIAATNRNLNKMMNEGLFRKDLFYRLNVIPIKIPLLKDRISDIPILVEYFVKKICLKEDIENKKITSEFIEALKKYSWPGNIRELENMIERCIAFSDDIIDSELLPSYITLKEIKNEEIINGPLLKMEEYEKAIIKKALSDYPSYNKAAKALGITHRTVSLKAKKYNIEKRKK